jgi:tetratricopeptide (TPR) repeat protein
LDSAWYYYNKFDTAHAANANLRIYLVSTGETYLLQKQYQKALPNLKRGLAIDEKLNDQSECKRALLDIAKTYLETGDNKTAIAYAKEGLALSIQSESRQFIRDAYYVFYSAF